MASAGGANDDRLEYLASSTLLRRSDPLEPAGDEASVSNAADEVGERANGAGAKSGTSQRRRHYELRRNADDESVIEAANAVLKVSGEHCASVGVRCHCTLRDSPEQAVLYPG